MRPDHARVVRAAAARDPVNKYVRSIEISRRTWKIMGAVIAQLDSK